MLGEGKREVTMKLKCNNMNKTAKILVPKLYPGSYQYRQSLRSYAKGSTSFTTHYSWDEDMHAIVIIAQKVIYQLTNMGL